jgi:hypothetical protein
VNEDSRAAAWREQRHRAVTAHTTADNRRRVAEAEQAGKLIAEFASRARSAGLRVSALTALAYNGRTRYRTGLRGWYLNPARSLAVTEDGQFYILSVPTSLRARFAGAVLEPAEPRLVIGVGARDGDSIRLPALLELRLAAGDAAP